jgi:hypothetical protein
MVPDPERPSSWFGEAACLLAITEGNFSKGELQHCSFIPISDNGASLPFLDDLSDYHHFQVARALAPSIRRSVLQRSP